MEKVKSENEDGSSSSCSLPGTKHLIRRERFYRTGYFIAALAFGTILLLLYLAEIRHVPDAGENDAIYLFGMRMPETCLYHRIFGRPCLGCGLTHGVVSLLDGKFHRASEIHPSSVWVTIWIATQMILRLVLVFSPSGFFPPLVPDLSISLASMVISIYLPIVW